MKQVISYSLYGQQMKFLVGAIKNAQLAQRFFPEFTVRFYVGNSVPTWTRSTLALFPNVEMITVDEPENSISRMWRFRAILDPSVDVVLSRDADARLSYREVIAHQEFLSSQIYPQIAGNCLVHDPYYNYQPSEPSKKKMIPRKKINTVCHIGAALDENDVFVYRADLEMSLEESGHVKYIYDWGTDEDLNYRK